VIFAAINLMFEASQYSALRKQNYNSVSLITVF